MTSIYNILQPLCNNCTVKIKTSLLKHFTKAREKQNSSYFLINFQKKTKKPSRITRATSLWKLGSKETNWISIKIFCVCYVKMNAVTQSNPDMPFYGFSFILHHVSTICIFPSLTDNALDTCIKHSSIFFNTCTSWWQYKIHNTDEILHFPGYQHWIYYW